MRATKRPNSIVRRELRPAAGDAARTARGLAADRPAGRGRRASGRGRTGRGLPPPGGCACWPAARPRAGWHAPRSQRRVSRWKPASSSPRRATRSHCPESPRWRLATRCPMRGARRRPIPSTPSWRPAIRTSRSWCSCPVERPALLGAPRGDVRLSEWAALTDGLLRGRGPDRGAERGAPTARPRGRGAARASGEGGADPGPGDLGRTRRRAGHDRIGSVQCRAGRCAAGGRGARCPPRPRGRPRLRVARARRPGRRSARTGRPRTRPRALPRGRAQSRRTRRDRPPRRAPTARRSCS